MAFPDDYPALMDQAWHLATTRPEGATTQTRDLLQRLRDFTAEIPLDRPNTRNIRLHGATDLAIEEQLRTPSYEPGGAGKDLGRDRAVLVRRLDDYLAQRPAEVSVFGAAYVAATDQGMAGAWLDRIQGLMDRRFGTEAVPHDPEHIANRVSLSDAVDTVDPIGVSPFDVDWEVTGGVEHTVDIRYLSRTDASLEDLIADPSRGRTSKEIPEHHHDLIILAGPGGRPDDDELIIRRDTDAPHRVIAARPFHEPVTVDTRMLSSQLVQSHASKADAAATAIRAIVDHQPLRNVYLNRRLRQLDNATMALSTQTADELYPDEATATETLQRLDAAATELETLARSIPVKPAKVSERENLRRWHECAERIGFDPATTRFGVSTDQASIAPEALPDYAISRCAAGDYVYPVRSDGSLDRENVARLETDSVNVTDYMREHYGAQALARVSAHDEQGWPLEQSGLRVYSISEPDDALTIGGARHLGDALSRPQLEAIEQQDPVSVLEANVDTIERRHPRTREDQFNLVEKLTVAAMGEHLAPADVALSERTAEALIEHQWSADTLRFALNNEIVDTATGDPVLDTPGDTLVKGHPSGFINTFDLAYTPEHHLRARMGLAAVAATSAGQANGVDFDAAREDLVRIAEATDDEIHYLEMEYRNQHTTSIAPE